MRLVFGPDDHEGYPAARERLQSLVVAWARRRGIPVEPALVAAALDHRHGVDGRFGRWTRAHVADALAVWFPRTVALLDDDRDAVPVALHALIGFLAERDWLDHRVGDPRPSCTPRSTTAPPPCTTRWPTSATVTSARSGPSSCAATASRPRTRRPSPASSSRCAAARSTSTATRSRRSRAATAGIPSPTPAPGPEPGPGAAAGRRGAARVGGDRRGRGAAAHRHPLGAHRPGRSPPTAGCCSPTPARWPATLDVDAFSRDHARTADDLPETSLLVAWARQARLLRVVKGRLVPVKSAAALLGRPIELWQRAFVALGTLGEHFGGSNVFGAPSLFGMSLGEALPMLLLDLYAAGGRSGPGRAVPPRGSATRSTSGSAASSTTSRATSSSGCGAATSPRCSTPWSCSERCT